MSLPATQVPPVASRAPAVQFDDVSVAYGTRVVVSEVTAALRPGSFVGLLGPNGAGKTTLLKALVGVLPLAGGAIRVHGMPRESAWRHLAYLPQHEHVNWQFPLSVLEVALMGRVRALGWLRRPGGRERRWAMEALDRVGMADFAGRQIGQLSAGQRQRVLLARALAQGGDLLALDEPLAGVDATTQEAVLRLLAELRDQGVLVLISTHDLSLAANACDYLLCLNRRLIAAGPTPTVFTPGVLRATYGDAVAFLEGGLVIHDAHH